jgi:lipopolysaccharide/colanic/teichoic acid biosynthesis glycosyltransferase
MKNPDQNEVRRNSSRANFPRTGVKNFPIRGQIRPGDRIRRWHTGQIHATQAFKARRPNPILFGGGAARYNILKRSFDIALCMAVLPLALPVLAACALAVRLSSPGPVLFVQQRTGRGGRPFSMLKIRTMVVDAEQQKAALKEQDTVLGPDFKPTNDPRVTRVGALLRKTSLDELPQLWNVLKGDMSLVGPRPTSFGVDTYLRWHTERLEVRPGVTGLWQIRLRGDTNFDERVRLDITYVRTRSLSVDLWILLRTLPSVLLGRGAF